MKKRIGFMGLGTMGRPMAENILRNGYPLTVYNRTREKCAMLRELGAFVAATPRELAERSDVVVTMVPGPEAVLALLTGEDGCARGMGPHSVFVNMGTMAPAYAREIAASLRPLGVACVDAPVSGSRRPAEEGRLVVLAGGPAEVVDALRPLFLTMGRKVIHCGAQGQGAMAKMVVNLLLGVMMEGVGEMLNFGRRGGLDDATLFDVLDSGPLACDLFAAKQDMLRTGAYPAQFALRNMDRDMRAILDTAAAAGAATPAANAVSQLYRAACARGRSDMDVAAVMGVLEALSGDGTR
ncbi:3-hydroxyisobutyrate dehydrogenase-like beta-hydroxyacid dehydrogenase [Desulfobaculum xiamenense]|uniref:3-hydroxyisobutyrate dehydrogenase-like beta-hydroxyacid dehydrogenase n=2 Tax=Desulfobaculum xiamenense TaxID=995050 RepID=A0A846QKJ2_9BACT|nr:3-hydroxyisobutyrate dehydrogenase-like beta-hydroxyacid dehydrogenase [Desulfobaculum xiamenense]